jgi:hypothetical protein
MSHLSSLSVFSADEIPRIFKELKLYFPEEASEVTDWFQNNYVHGRISS